MKKIGLFLFNILLLAMTASAQFAQPVKTAVEMKQVGDNEIEVVMRATIDAGWHIYGNGFPDNGPTQASVHVEKKEGATPKGSLKISGKADRHYDDMFGQEVVSYEGSVTMSQRFTLAGGRYTVAGYFEFGACNDESCIPPQTVDFEYSGEAPDKKAKEAAPDKTQPVADQPALPADKVAEDATVADSVAPAEAQDSVAAVAAANADGDLWTPVIDEIKAFGEGEAAEATNASLWAIFLMGVVGGLLALLTPCVWPIIPMTVSFFLKRNKDSQGKAVREAVTYGISIVIIYVLLGTLVSAIFGPSALNALSTNAVFNLFFCALLVVFAASFMGAFEITLPSSWSNSVDAKAEKTTGLLSIFLMAFTLALVSFSCTGPIIGFLLVEVATTGDWLAPTIGMLGFAIALALPFTLFAMFPTWLKKAPRSGGWMNRIKVTLGFIELAFALKFFSVADMAYGWRLLDREVFIVLWVMLFALLGLYLLGCYRFAHDDEEEEGIGVTRFFVAMVSLAFALYMVPGLWGAPLKAVSAFTPPMNTQDFKLGSEEVRAQYFDYEQGMAAARAAGKPALLDFTGYGCVNCRKMEAAVWTDPEVAKILMNDYVLITLYVDEKAALPEPLERDGKRLRTVGDKWSYLQASKFGANTQPFYVPVDAAGHPLAAPYSYNEDVPAYVEWLKKGLK